MKNENTNHNVVKQKRMEKVKPEFPSLGRPPEETMTLIERDAPNKSEGHYRSNTEQTRGLGAPQTTQKKPKTTSPKKNREGEPNKNAKGDVNKCFSGRGRRQSRAPMEAKTEKSSPSHRAYGAPVNTGTTTFTLNANGRKKSEQEDSKPPGDDEHGNTQDAPQKGTDQDGPTECQGKTHTEEEYKYVIHQVTRGYPNAETK